MKVCPKCARSFADGFTYCPQDAAPLERYDLRARVNAGDEFHFLLESESLPRRLKRELAGAVEEMRRNPRGFLRGLLRGEGGARQRKRLLQVGVTAGLIAYASIIAAALLLGLFRSPYSDQRVDAAPPAAPPLIQMIPILTRRADQTKSAVESNRGLLGGSPRQSQPKRASGGGGNNDALPASRGEMPAPTLLPQINPPDLEPPKIKFATLIAPETVYADDAFQRRIAGPFGLRHGQTFAPSRGDGDGTGIGPGDGPGYGQGRRGNLGGNEMDRGSGAPDGDGARPLSATLKPNIFYREKARYTEEARQRRIQGSVMLSLVFGADGRIRDIRALRGLPHGLTESAIEAARRIRFQPAIDHGRPVSVRGEIEFSFALY